MAGLYYPSYTGQLPNQTVNVIGTGGIYSTAEDLVRFSQIFTGEAKEILSGNSVQAMAQDEYKTSLWPDDADNSIGYGLGWDSVNLYPFSEYGIKALTKEGTRFSMARRSLCFPSRAWQHLSSLPTGIARTTSFW
ncbi:hypothetical protein [Cohnella fermenti]|uniref:hypothetical protein n=1 Tax=Cohnella fermenti TaxID=2565925 RepID=UPI001E40868C|nr:hypothetical protein [Cohnella fermenti]